MPMTATARPVADKPPNPEQCREALTISMGALYYTTAWLKQAPRCIHYLSLSLPFSPSDSCFPVSVQSNRSHVAVILVAISAHCGWIAARITCICDELSSISGMSFPQYLGRAFLSIWGELSSVSGTSFPCGTSFPQYLGRAFLSIWEELSSYGTSFAQYLGRAFLVGQAFLNIWDELSSVSGKSFPHIWGEFASVSGTSFPQYLGRAFLCIWDELSSEPVQCSTVQLSKSFHEASGSGFGSGP
jgi:hypothetical protein